MNRGITVWLRGAAASETARALVRRLVELGHNAETIDAPLVALLGGAAGAAQACRLLSRNGVIVAAAFDGARPEGACIEIALSVHDTPDFAAEKILDALADAGLVNLGSGGYAPEQEERIKQRLADLGYIE